MTTQTFPPRKLIGILGGMGPAATIDLMAKIVAATPAGVDQEHVPVLAHNVPQIPDRSTAIQAGSDAPFLPMLAGVRLLDQAGVDRIAIACNTAHFWYERLSRACRAPIIHIADAVVDTLRIRPSATRAVALLATRGTVGADIYQPRLAKSGLDVLIPDEATQQCVDRVIAAVKGGRLAEGEDAARQVAERIGPDARLLLACTELPIAFAGAGLMDACIDATEALAQACVAASLSQAEAPHVVEA